MVYSILIIILLFFNLDGLYLIDTNYDFFGLFDFDDITFFVNIVSTIFFLIKAKKYEKIKYNYKAFLIFLIVLCFTCSFQSMILYNQNIISTIMRHKKIIFLSLLYFPIEKLIKYGEIKTESLWKILDTYAIIQLILFIGQYFLRNTITFMNINVGVRYRDIRYYYNPLLLDLFLMRSLNGLLKGNKIIINIARIALVLFEVIIVQKFRFTTIALLIIIVLSTLLYKVKVFKKVLFLCFVGIFCVFMFNSNIVQDFLSEFSSTDKTSSYLIRESGRNYYFNMLLSHPLLGGGYPINDDAMRASGYYDNIYLGDNGIIGFAYIYGGLGILWFILLWKKMINTGYKIHKNTDLIFYLLFPLFMVITCINEIHWYWQSGYVILIFFIILMEGQFLKIGDNGENNN